MGEAQGRRQPPLFWWPLMKTMVILLGANVTCCAKGLFFDFQGNEVRIVSEYELTTAQAAVVVVLKKFLAVIRSIDNVELGHNLGFS